ncbi:putative NAD(P)/FAD-binding protein YdhS [Frondihabitans sp. PhB188]|uniref:FAD/NAD(P)-binding protein n=1 Tax=Frondihabitans sp. PhB188 TaxID=2485200 RepID=UPI000F47BB0E|nr:FAD/NAD(P)-binding protein [Frondihabitans sp. PhB188]ROQ36520.1 putative NAD(P)/FAD-binding protein YdhS [Frondihabitans sp. PhB188]
MTSKPSSVIIVGGGASAVFATVALRERAVADGVEPPRITVVGREEVVGRGLAYGRADAHHRLNSPAGKMSLTASDADGFLRHLDETGWRDVDGSSATPGAFVPREVFGDYVEAAFRALVDDPASGVAFEQGEVADVDDSGTGPFVTLADGTALAADAVVLALGNPAPGRVPTGAARAIDDPWAVGALDGIDASDHVLLIGTGLTMIDVATSLARRLPGIRMTATSRHLLLPAVHPSVPAAPGPGLGDGLSTLGGMMSAFSARLHRAEAEGTPWQAVVDGVRPQTQALWLALDQADRERFLAHGARRWDVHRHRMAQAVWAELSGLLDAETLTIAADVDTSGFDVAVNCTGPASVASRGWSPLVDRLLDRGLVAGDPTGLGFDADPDGALLGAEGLASGRLFGIGASLKGALWETVAIGEVRLMASKIAARLGVPATAAA